MMDVDTNETKNKNDNLKKNLALVLSIIALLVALLGPQAYSAFYTGAEGVSECSPRRVHRAIRRRSDGKPQGGRLY